MIVGIKAKVAVLLPPKTGTRTIIGMCTRPEVVGYMACLQPGHIMHHVRHQVLEDIDDYRLFGFYRCPVDRVVSNYRFSVQQWSAIEGLPIAKEAAAEVARQVRALTLSEYLDLLEVNMDYSTLDLARPQTKWLQPGVELLDFRRFDDELMRLQTAMGCPNPIVVPKANGTDSGDYINLVTADDVTRIKQLYAEDYEFFASCGITFER